MCIYDSVFGSGGVLASQLLTVFSIAASILLWAGIYRHAKIPLMPYALPLILWIFLGTLDITITAKGTFGNPLNEGNPLARAIFVETGFYGPAIASIVWISLWNILVLLANITKIPQRRFLSLMIFYSLACGHLFCFSSWFRPFCGIAIAGASFTELFFLSAIVGIMVAVGHITTVRYITD